MDAKELQRYLGIFTVVAEPRAVQNMPEAWREIFGDDDQELRVSSTIGMWSASYRDKLSSLISTFNESLTHVDLIQNTDGLSVLYTFTVKGESRYYIGKHPIQKPATADIQAFLGGLPEDFTLFYETIHNGWYEVASEAMGPASIEGFIILSEQEWGILDEIDIDFSLNKVVSVFSNGSGGIYAGITTGLCQMV